MQQDPPALSVHLSVGPFFIFFHSIGWALPSLNLLKCFCRLNTAPAHLLATWAVMYYESEEEDSENDDLDHDS